MSPALSDAVAAMAAALQVTDPEWRLRDERFEDRGFVANLYATTRWDELTQLPWSDSAKTAFLHEQSRLQADHYRKNYPGAALCVLEHAGAAVGRIYLYASPGEFRVMDIALLPHWRGRGHGECMLRTLMQTAAEEGRAITLHVEPNNPAQRLYARLGFTLREDKGVYHFLGWTPRSQLSTAS
ncbi:MAG: GNAT family N-acetyltransferase [Rhodanobacteraceae bacterium]|nr:GNAT family N-acetyltransferase [Rhodanobacteraceae bacterium]MBP9154605.1 GNAT family N-acetyltransferase [Xanthomonadales bacterium]HQW80868.1 GNAT family N-acetyltransferase [Pseudomonadota bacterium]